MDIRYSLRMLARTPIVTVVAILSLALGIGANTAIFSLMNALVLRSLPVSEPGRLIKIDITTTPQGPDRYSGMSLAMFQLFQKEQRVFADLFTWGTTIENLEAGGVKYLGGSSTVSGDYYSSLGIKPYIGRLIGPEDLSLDAGFPAPVAVISYGCWQRRYQGDRNVLGKTITARQRPLTIIGVTPPNFSGLNIDGDTDVTVPIGFSGSTIYRTRKWLGLGVHGHLKPGVTIEQARVQIDSIWPRILDASIPEGFAGAQRDEFLSNRIRMESFATGESFLRRRFTRPLNVLMMMVGLLLLIACVNLANLMLARAAGRSREFALRLALGATRWRLLRQMLTESLMLSATGAVLGFVVAHWACRYLSNMMWTGLTTMGLNAAPDGRVLLFTTLIAVLTGTAFGVAPAFGIFRTDPAQSLGNNSRSVRGSASRIGKGLISLQVALSIVLVIGAVLFVRSLDRLRAADVGYRRDGMAMMMMLFPQKGPQGQKMLNRVAYYKELVERMRQLPGVESASYSEGGPMTVYEYTEAASRPSSPEPPLQAVQEVIGPEFFHLAGMRLLAGRDFTWRDDDTARPVAIISESLSRRMYPAGDALGNHIDSGERKGLEIVGIVNSASLWVGRSHEPMAVYLALMQLPEDNSPTLDLRMRGNVLADAGHVVESMGWHYSIRSQTLEQRADSIRSTDRIIALLSSFFGGLALLLASIGLYGLMSYAVERRTPEIGVRMALGARSSEVQILILRDVLWLVLAGLCVGIPLAWACSRLISGMVYGVTIDDPVTIALSSSILLIVSAVAGYLPARRASRIDPMVALRSE